MSLAAAEEQLSSMLDESVRLHMISDVPVGFLLSGGVDSSAMLCMARGKTEGPLLSFTVGFTEPGVTDERPYARLAADTYGAEHHEMTISSKDFENFLPQYIWHMEEPGLWQTPGGRHVLRLSTGQEILVKVLISGEGGDEGGSAAISIYRNLLWLERLKSLLKPMNGSLSKGLLGLNPYLKSSQITRFAPLLDMPFESYYHSGTSNAAKFFKQNMGTLYSDEFAPQVNKERSANIVKKYLQNSAGRDLVNRMLYVDTKTWLVDDLLLKADKMTIANSLELRVSFLDHKVLEFAASLPGKYKVHGFTTKYILKRVLSNRVPQEILNRKKVGFPVPYNAWLRTDLKDWIRDLLLDRETLQRGYFNRNCIERLISQNTALGGTYSKELFHSPSWNSGTANS